MHRYTLAQCSEIPSEELDDHVLDDFNLLVSISIADAVGYRRLPPETSAWLRSPDRREDWIQALIFARGELQSAVERMAFTYDSRLALTDKKLQAVVRQAKEARNLASLAPRGTTRAARAADPVYTTLEWLAAAFLEETGSIRKTLLQQRGLPPAEPRRDNPADGGWDEIEHACRSGILHTPITKSIQPCPRQTTRHGFHELPPTAEPTTNLT